MEEKLAIPDSAVSRQAARTRLVVGFLQGVLLYILYRSVQDKIWPATDREIFAPLLLAVFFIPVLLISGLGHLGNRQLLRWTGFALPIVLALGYYDIWRGGSHATGWLGSHSGTSFPSPLLFFFTGIGLFISQALVLASAADKRFIARYSTYFEASWKLAIQLIFSQWFIGALWAVLWIGAALFMLIKLDFLTRLLTKPWFFIPVTALAFSSAFHLTDVKPAIVRGIRTLLLVLMSWLLPLATIIVLGFMVGLLGSGLEPLWATRNATAVLLGTAAVLVLLINATFQNGEIGDQLARILRYSARVAAVLLTPIILIAVYALWLRVQDYGWTTDRLIAAACLVVAGCYAAGYLWATIDRTTWLRRIAPGNVLTSLVILAVLLALFSPIADPARISVASQLARLSSGKIHADKFDFDYLKFDGVRYGTEALEKLKILSQGPDSQLVREKAAAALKKQNRWEQRHDHEKADTAEIAANLHVRADEVLPPSFLKQDWSSFKNQWLLPQCLKSINHKCDANLIDFNKDGTREILLISDQGGDNNAPIFMLNAAGAWEIAGTLQLGAYRSGQCRNDLLEALATGTFKLVPSLLNDVEVAGQRIPVAPGIVSGGECRTASVAGKK